MMHRFKVPTREHLIGGVLQPSVDARDLWAFFRPYSPFANWIARKLNQHPHFVKGTDFVRVEVTREISYGGHIRLSHQVDYMMTVTLAEAIGNREFCRGPVPWK